MRLVKIENAACLEIAALIQIASEKRMGMQLRVTRLESSEEERHLIRCIDPAQSRIEFQAIKRNEPLLGAYEISRVQVTVALAYSSICKSLRYEGCRGPNASEHRR